MRSPFDALRRLFPARGPSLTELRLTQAKVRLAELRGKRSVSAWGDRGWQPIMGGAQLRAEGSFESWSSQQLAEQYSKHSLVRACIDEVSKSVQDGTLQVGRDTDNGFEPEDIDELLDPLYNDPDYSFGDIWTLVVSRLMATGASFSLLGQYEDILGAGEFTPVPTNQVRVYSNGVRVTRYEFYAAQEKPLPLKREEVCALWFPDPARQIGWVSPLAAAAHAYQIDEQREALTHETLKNRVMPGGIIQTVPGPMGRTLTPDQAKELKQKIDDACGTDAAKRGGMLVIPHGLQFGKGQDLEDIDFAVLNALTETRICMAFGVPPIVVAAKSGLDAATYANYREARRAFYVETIRPLWSFLGAGLTRALILNQGLDRKLYYQWDHSKVAELQPDADKAMTRAVQGYSGQVLTLDEARAEAGKQPDESGRGAAYYTSPAPSLLPEFGKTAIRGKADEGGHWVTINGTPVFIREGESPTEAIERQRGGGRERGGGEGDGQKPGSRRAADITSGDMDKLDKLAGRVDETRATMKEYAERRRASGSTTREAGLAAGRRYDKAMKDFSEEIVRIGSKIPDEHLTTEGRKAFKEIKENLGRRLEDWPSDSTYETAIEEITEYRKEMLVRLEGRSMVATLCNCHAKAGAAGPLPEVGRIEAVFKAHFARQRADALAAVAHGARHRFDLDAENDKLAKALEPALRDIYEARGKRVLKRIADRLGTGNGRKTRIQGKAEFRPEASFTLYRGSYNELLAKQIKKLVAETNETTRADLDNAIDRAITEAHERGGSADLRGVVENVFDGATEWRAKAIAGTESSRAIHDSNVLAAESSGVVKGFLPLISADACEVCLSHEGEFTSLEDAKTQLGQYEGRGLPPFHPNDRCSAEEVLTEETV